MSKLIHETTSVIILTLIFLPSVSRKQSELLVCSLEALIGVPGGALEADASSRHCE